MNSIYENKNKIDPLRVRIESNKDLKQNNQNNSKESWTCNRCKLIFEEKTKLKDQIECITRKYEFSESNTVIVFEMHEKTKIGYFMKQIGMVPEKGDRIFRQCIKISFIFEWTL